MAADTTDRSAGGVEPRVAVVLAPGGLPGIDAHVGAWTAFEAAGIRPTAIYGCSAGAVIGALWASGRYSAFEASSILRKLGTEDVLKWRVLAWPMIRRYDYLANPAPIRALLERLLPETFEDLEIPLTVAATAMTGRAHPYGVRIGAGDLRSAVLASMSIAGVWPYVTRELSAAIPPVQLSDGGTTDAIALPERLADWDAVYVVDLVDRVGYEKRDSSAASRLLWNITGLARKEPAWERQQLIGQANVRWLELDTRGVSCFRFDHSLIDTCWTDAFLQLSRQRHPLGEYFALDESTPSD